MPLRAGAPALPLLLTLTIPAWAQRSGDRAAIEQAVATYARSEYPNRRLGLWPPGDSAASPEHLRDLAERAGARVMGQPGVGTCVENPAEDCIQVVLQIGVPSVEGDTAQVVASAWWPEHASVEEPRLRVARIGSRWQVVRTIETRDLVLAPFRPAEVPSELTCADAKAPQAFWRPAEAVDSSIRQYRGALHLLFKSGESSSAGTSVELLSDFWQVADVVDSTGRLSLEQLRPGTVRLLVHAAAPEGVPWRYLVTIRNQYADTVLVDLGQRCQRVFGAP